MFGNYLDIIKCKNRGTSAAMFSFYASLIKQISHQSHSPLFTPLILETAVLKLSSLRCLRLLFHPNGDNLANTSF